MGPRPADGVATGHARKRGVWATGGCEGRRVRWRESHLWDGRQGGRHGSPMGRENNTAGKREAAGVGKVKTPGEWG